MRQAKDDARAGEMPAVMHRKNGGDWLVTMSLEDWITVYREWQAGQELEGKQ